MLGSGIAPITAEMCFLFLEATVIFASAHEDFRPFEKFPSARARCCTRVDRIFVDLLNLYTYISRELFEFVVLKIRAGKKRRHLGITFASLVDGQNNESQCLRGN